jgi:Ni2+-binding GTPase involved in maturation of urease and hydrogenase
MGSAFRPEASTRGPDSGPPASASDQDQLGADAPLVIVLLGATASGKTDLAIAIAEAFDLAVLSVDSRQIYDRDGHRHRQGQRRPTGPGAPRGCWTCARRTSP